MMNLGFSEIQQDWPTSDSIYEDDRDRGRVEGFLVARKIQPFQSDKTATAKFQDGRWLADCPECYGAERVHPDHKFLCGSCGAFASVEWE